MPAKRLPSQGVPGSCSRGQGSTRNVQGRVAKHVSQNDPQPRVIPNGEGSTFVVKETGAFAGYQQRPATLSAVIIRLAEDTNKVKLERNGTDVIALSVPFRHFGRIAEFSEHHVQAMVLK